MYAITLPWEQSNNNLMWAVENRAQLRVTARLARDWGEIPAEFLAGEMLKSLAVSRFPEPWTDKMLAGQLLPCSFRRGHKKYMFVSAVTGHEAVEIDGRKREAYTLAWPEGLQEMQRRYYFRAAVPSQFDLFVRIWDSVPAIGGSPVDEPLTMGRLVDISAGGAQVEVPIAQSLEIDRSYLLEIELPKPEAPALVQARARRMEADLDGGTCRYGLQFLSLDHSPRGQDTMVRLARFANYLRNCQPAEAK